MSKDDIWFFLRGEETVGPFSKEILQQIHKGGQLVPETMVWREGMESWKPAGEVPELELISPIVEPEITPITPPTAPTANIAAGSLEPGTHGKLKMKARHEPTTSVSSPTIPSPQVPAVPAPKSNLKILPIVPKVEEALSPAKSEEPPLLQDEEEKGPSVLKKLADRWINSLVLTPLFLIIAGSMIFFHDRQFPNVLWFVWIAGAFAVIGVISLLGIHTFDGLTRLLAFALLAPSLILLWPVIMNEKSWRVLTMAEYVFFGFSFPYFLTVRIGLTNYIVPSLARVACITGILTLAFIWMVGTRPALIPPTWGWDRLVKAGNHIRLPGAVARIVGKPEWGSDVGTMRIGAGPGESRHGIEFAGIRKWAPKEYRLLLRSLDGFNFVARMVMSDDWSDPLKDPRCVVGRDWPILFSGAAFSPGSQKLSDEGEPVSAKWTMKNGDVVEVRSATLQVANVSEGQWTGNIDFNVSPGTGGRPGHLMGTFEVMVESVEN